jgi:hypothetical protein
MTPDRRLPGSCSSSRQRRTGRWSNGGREVVAATFEKGGPENRRAVSREFGDEGVVAAVASVAYALELARTAGQDRREGLAAA